MLSLQSDSVWLQICVQNSSHHAEFLFNVAFRVKCFKCSSKGSVGSLEAELQVTHRVQQSAGQDARFPRRS